MTINSWQWHDESNHFRSHNQQACMDDLISLHTDKIVTRWSLFMHYSDIIMGAMASQITSLAIVKSTLYLGVDQRKHQSFASLKFVRVIHRSPVNSPHEGPARRKMFPFDDVIMSGWYHQTVFPACVTPLTSFTVESEISDFTFCRRTVFVALLWLIYLSYISVALFWWCTIINWASP